MLTSRPARCAPSAKVRRTCAWLLGLLLASAPAGAMALAGDGSIAVVVVGPDHSLVASCWLRMESAAQTRTIPVRNGYESVGSPPERTRVLVYGARDANGRALPWAPFHGVLVPGATQLRVAMSPGVEIRGRVIDGSGAAVEGAAVTAHGPTHSVSEEPVAAATTDAEGAFVLVGLGEDGYVVRARRAPSDIAAAMVREVGGSSSVVLTLPSTKDVTVTIVDWKDEPIPDVSLSLYEVHGALKRSYVAFTRTDAQGVARWNQLAATATYDLHLDTPPSRDDLAELEHRPWKPVDGRLKVPRGYVITGTVKDPAGRAVRAKVVRRAPDWRWTSILTNEDGTFRLTRVPYGRVLLEAYPLDATPNASGPTGDWDVAAATPEQAHVQLTLREKRASAPGTPNAPAHPRWQMVVLVLAPDGSPVPEASVSFTTTAFDAVARASKGKANVDTRGAAGRLFVVGARDEEGRPLDVIRAERVVESWTRELTVKLQRPVEIRGRVLDEAGAPVEGALVQAVTETVRDCGPEGESRTGVDGVFRLVGLSPRAYGLRVPRPPHPWAPPPDARAEGGATDIVIGLRRGESRALVVLDAAGRPLAGAKVSLHQVALDDASAVTDILGSRSVESGPNGEVHLPPADPRQPPYLTIEPPENRDDLVGFHPASSWPRAWNPASGPIRLARGFVVTGTVRDKAGNGGASVIYRSTTPEEQSEGADVVRFAGGSERDGTFRLRGLPYGPVRLFAVRAQMRFDVPEGAALVTPESPTVELTVDAD